jgi:hypothetical protein
MAKLVLVLSVLVAACGLATAAEPKAFKWTCKKPSVSFKAKLAGATNPRGKQYPVGTFEVCLALGEVNDPVISIKQ